jgi:glycosyltransferase involved in cell wall biosynthesis
MISVASIVLNNFLNDSRVLKEVISLRNNDFKVCVIALHENDLDQEEIVEDILVRRVKLSSRSWSKNKFVQIFKYFEFLHKAYQLVKRKDIIHCNDLKALPVGFLVKKLFNSQVKIVYDAHEYETQMYGLSKLDKFFAFIIEKNLISSADVVFTVSDSIADEYKKLYSIAKPTLIFNTPVYKDVTGSSQDDNVFRLKFNIAENQKIFIYQGGFSKSRGIESILVAFDQLNTDFKGEKDSLPVVVFMGYGILLPLVLQFSNRCPNIFYHPAVKINEVFDYTKCADFGILYTENSCLNNFYCMPNKIFEYLMAEVPVIASNTKDVKNFVDQKNVGEVAESNDVYGLLNAIKKILSKDASQFRENILSVKKEYNWQSQEKKMIEAYHNL